MFRLGEKQPKQHDGLVFYYTEYVDKETQTPSMVCKIVDDASLPGETLGLRRLQLKQQGELLHRITLAVYFIADLVKLAKSTTWFIDSSGRVFQYQKTSRAKLTTRKIKQVLPGTGLGCVVEVAGVSSRFKSMIRPTESEVYAVLLKYGLGFLLYGFSETHRPDSWRMI